MKTRSSLLALAIFAAAACGMDPGVTEPAPEPPPTEVDLGWLQSNLLPIRTDAPGGDYSDLMPLKEIIGNARIVALGEGTHGTREFFRMKHRMLEFLVREMGFDLFAIEAAWAESNRVDDFVRTGVGDPFRLLSGLHFWTWNTQEVFDMIGWMRQYNAATPDGIRFLGFDMQSSALAMEDVVAFVGRVNPLIPGTVSPMYSCWRTWQFASTYPTTHASTRETCRAGIEAAHAHLETHRAEYEAATSPAEFAKALRAARIVVQNEHIRSRRWEGHEPYPRDRFMAENVEWILEHSPGSRIVLWAHNGHVSDSPQWMGGYLREKFGDDMVVVGFSFGSGQFNAIPVFVGQGTGPLSVQNAPAASPGSYEYEFDRVNEAGFLFDLRPLRGEVPGSTAWLRGPRPVRMIGAVFFPAEPDRNNWNLALHEGFDLWIHFRTTTASQLLPFLND